MDKDPPPELRAAAWPDIVGRYRTLREGRSSDSVPENLAAIEALAAMIAKDDLAPALFGWTSMNDLCIQQTDAYPGSGPYLRVSPLASGLVEFRYIDTLVTHRQWCRRVPPEATLARFRSFLEQLRWIAM